MADITAHTPNATPAAETTLISQLTAPFRAIGRALVAMAEAGPRMAQLRRLSEMTDEELAARGTTRNDEVRRIFGASLYA